MNRQNLQLLINALRSGDYIQVCDILHDKNDRYCVWGVGCNVFHLATGRGSWIRDGNAFEFMVDGYSDACGPPIEVIDWYGVNSDFVDQLISDNDNTEDHKDFLELADMIEQHVLTAPVS